MTRSRKLVVLDGDKYPYPPSIDFRITKFHYIDHLQIVRYNARPKKSPKNSDWQLVEDYAVEIDIDYNDASGKPKKECWRIVAPKGLYTDLTSVPAFGRWIVAKVGPQLEASIIHDYLYMKWTDAHLKKPRCSDWVFADEVLRAGMKNLTDFSGFQRFVVNFAVGTAGWWVFRQKEHRLADLMTDWVPHLNYRPHTPVPPSEQAKPKGFSFLKASYQIVSVLVFLSIVTMGIDQLFNLFEWDNWRESIAIIVGIATWPFLALTSVMGAFLSLGLLFYFFMRGYIWIRKRLA